MKPILFILTIFLGMSNIKCQEYQYKTFIDTNFVWSHAFFALSGPHTPYTYYVRNYFTGSDTTINDKIYYKHTQGLIRSEEKRFYFYDEGLNKDVLILDFDAKVGDTIFSNKYYNYFVDSIDTVLVNNTYRKRLFVSSDFLNPGGFGFKLIWIEGIGNINYGIKGLYTSSMGFYQNFCGFSEKGIRVYPPNSVSVECERALVPVINFDIKNINVFPNPTNNFILIDDANFKYNRNCKLYDTFGKLVADLEINNNRISLENIQGGMYILYLVDKNNNIHLGKIVKE